MPGVNIGVFCSTPAVGVARNVGRKRAMEMLLTGEPIDAATAAGGAGASWQQHLRSLSAKGGELPAVITVLAHDKVRYVGDGVAMVVAAQDVAVIRPLTAQDVELPARSAQPGSSTTPRVASKRMDGM